MKTKLNLTQALPLAEKIRSTLSPGCERIDTPEEKDVFDLIGGAIPATDRDLWRKYCEGVKE